MDDLSVDVTTHYSVGDLEQQILTALRAAGKNPDDLTPNDLGPVEAFHVRGRESTAELAGNLGVQRSWRVLDVGCGIGGTCRYLASSYGCHVTGLDMTEEYCAVADGLSQRVGLHHLTSFRQGSALDLPFPDESFDAVWTEHVQMNIADKPRFYHELARVLRPGGRLAFHDIFQGRGGAPHFPVPWAGDPSISFLIAPDELDKVLQDCGFAAIQRRDTTSESAQWFARAIETINQHGLPPLGIHLLMPEDADAKLRNLTRNLVEGRTVVLQAVMRKETRAN